MMKINKTAKILLSLALVIFIVLTSPSCASPATPVKTPAGSGNISVEWPYSYPDLRSLCVNSDLIAIGTVNKTLEITKDGTLYFTKYLFQIETKLKGVAGTEVVINQTGTPEITDFEIADDPLFKVGEKYVLFLKSNTPGIYFNLGPWGRQQVLDNRVFSMNRLSPQISYNANRVDFNGINLSVFIQEIKTILDTPQVWFTHPFTRDPIDSIVLEAPGNHLIKTHLSLGKRAGSEVSFQISAVNDNNSTEIALPEGLSVVIEPTFIAVESGHTYNADLTVNAGSALKENIYSIKITYKFDDGTQGDEFIRIRVGYVTIPTDIRF